jgi:hypothetical protein
MGPGSSLALATLRVAGSLVRDDIDVGVDANVIQAFGVIART